MVFHRQQIYFYLILLIVKFCEYLPEHRNMPLEDAISLLARNFDAYLLREKASRPSEVSVVPATGPLTAINLTDRHPEAIQVSIHGVR